MKFNSDHLYGDDDFEEMREDLIAPEPSEYDPHRCDRLGCRSYETTFDEAAGMWLCESCKVIWNKED